MNRQINRYRFFYVSILCFAWSYVLVAGETLRFSVASTAAETGLVAYLVAQFNRDNPDVNIELTVTGGLAALDNGRAGRADAILTHVPVNEQMFMDDGYGLSKTLVMYNELAIFGPADDPLGLIKLHDLNEALKRLADNEVVFFVQGEQSGTYQKLAQLWDRVNIKPDWVGYEHTNTSSKSTLMMAAEFGGYTFADISTYMSLRESISDKVIPLFRDHQSLHNYYSYIVVAPEKIPGANSVLAERFLEFLVSRKTQELIAEYKSEGSHLTLFMPAAHLDKGLQIRQSQREKDEHLIYDIVLFSVFLLTLVLSISGYLLYKRSQRMERLASKHAERYEFAVTGTREGIFDNNLQTGKLFCSSRVYELLGAEYKKGQYSTIGQLIKAYVSNNTYAEFSRVFDQYLNESDTKPFEFKFELNNGNQRWLCIRATANIDENGKVVRLSGTLADVSELQSKTRALQYQALHDPLTQLPNRKLLDDRLTQVLAESLRYKTNFTLLLIDLNRFKYINDTLGHNMGDLLLKEVANRLQSFTRECDTIARLGGDEFAIILPQTNRKQGLKVAEKLTTAFIKPFEIQGRSLNVTGAIGCAFYPEHGQDKEILLQRADIAMYQCKNLKQSVVMYDENFDPYSERNIQLESDLSIAIDNNDLTLYYQPKIDLLENRIIGVEALVRWHHPKLGMVLPVEIVPLAERTGLIKKLTRFVVKEAVGQNVRWSGMNIILPVSINLSVWDLQDREFVTFVENIIKESGILASAIEFEITESSMMVDPELTLDILRALRKLGIHLSIDDFGTGFSSLSYLSNLPVNTLKIDKSFVLKMEDSRENMTIVRSTIELAHQLGLSAIAEGIESEAIVSLLNQFGCDQGQGYHIARPLPAAELLKWIEEHT
ncbi:MAG: EAL domain-containing protein [Gammaproteobacteria bacterium]|nr:EAL domain-containing protein [Gammaproteobacteria bacterium]